MFRKILFPTDFTKYSESAREYVIKLREAGTEEVVLMHVVEDTIMEAMMESCEWSNEDVVSCEEKVKQRIISDVESKLRGIKDILESHGLNVKTVVKIGNPASEIVKTAIEEGVSLIVMGSHGKSRLDEVLIGSVAENVVRHARNIPVLIVRR